nr:PREDICTED: aryl hydrocarbon receptor-like [Lepisosteus oculatus]
MLANVGIYAAKKRKKPVQKIPKPPPPDGAKSNPSKRHRDRLNCELDKLTSLLPFSEDVRARLDKLSVLRLSVGYLKVKSFFNATIKKHMGWLAERPFGGNGQSGPMIDGTSFSEEDLLLQALNGFVLVVTAEGYVFYASPTIQDYLGFHQSDVIHQSVFELIHTDDRAMFRRQLHFALNPSQYDNEQNSEVMQNSSSAGISNNIVTYDPQHIPPENSSFLERSFCCRLRCLLDNSSGFLALNFQGRLKYLHGQNKMSEDGTMMHSQLALFAIATPVQPPSILEIRTKTFIFQTKHKLDFTPMGCDTRGKVVLGYSEVELCMKGTGYQFIHAADMMYCADNHVRMIKTGESGLTVFRLLTKHCGWIWVQANARLVYKGGRPDFIVARQRALANEEGEEHFRQRKLQLPFHFATGEAVLYDTSPSLDDFIGSSKAPKIRKTSDQKPLDPDSLLGAMLKQDQSIYVSHAASEPQYSLDKAFTDSHSVVKIQGDLNPWQQGNPEHSAFKQENSTLAMIDTLEQLINDSNLCNTLQKLDVDELGLKDWENALLKMDINSDMSIELNDILTNDIFSYVEDALFKERDMVASPGSDQHNSEQTVLPNGFAANQLGNQNAFVNVQQNLFDNDSQSSSLSRGKNQQSFYPQRFPTTEIQNSLLIDQQKFNHQTQLLPNSQGVSHSQPNYVGMGAQSLVGSIEGAGDLKNVDPQIPVELHASSQIQQRINHTQTGDLPNQCSSLGLPEHSSQSTLVQNYLTFNQALTRSCMQNAQIGHESQNLSSPNQHQLKNMDINTQHRLRAASQASAGQAYPNSLALSAQGSLQPTSQAQQMVDSQQTILGQPNHMASSQNKQWVPSIPNTNFAQSVLQTCPLSKKELLLKPPTTSQLHGHFSVQTQNNSTLRTQPWQQKQRPQQQQQIPPVMQNGQHYPTEPLPERQTTSHLPSCYSTAQEHQCNTLGSKVLPQNSQNCRVGFGPQTANNIYRSPQGLMVNPITPSNSCMFENRSSVPLHGMQLSNTGLSASMALCQKLKPSPNQSPPQASCYFQRNASQHIVGTSVIPQEDISISPLSCQVQSDFIPESLLSHQFVNCNGQTQIRPVEENGSCSFPPVPNGNTFF